MQQEPPQVVYVQNPTFHVGGQHYKFVPIGMSESLTGLDDGAENAINCCCCIPIRLGIKLFFLSCVISALELTVMTIWTLGMLIGSSIGWFILAAICAAGLFFMIKAVKFTKNFLNKDCI